LRKPRSVRSNYHDVVSSVMSILGDSVDFGINLMLFVSLCKVTYDNQFLIV